MAALSFAGRFFFGVWLLLAIGGVLVIGAGTRWPAVRRVSLTVWPWVAFMIAMVLPLPL